MNVVLVSSNSLRQLAVRAVPRKSFGLRHSSSSAEKRGQDAFSEAQKAVGRAWKSVDQVLGPVVWRVSNLLGSYKEPLVYNFSVVREVAKRIYHGEALQPPSLSQITEVYCQIWSNMTQASYWRSIVQDKQVIQVGIYGLQAYGIFMIGEMVGRRQIIGYPVKQLHH